MKMFQVAIGLFAVLMTNASAQWNLFLDTKLTHENNLLRIYRPTADKMLTPQVGIAYIGRDYELFYTADYLKLVTQSQYDYHVHLAGVDFFKENNPLFKYSWGVNLLARFDRPEYANYDYFQFTGYCNWRLNLADWTMLKAGAEIMRKHFYEEKAWNHWEAQLFYTQNFYLPTHSTLRLGITYLRRDFLPLTLQPGDYDWSTGGYLDSVTSYRTELPTLDQLVATLRWAQSISSNLGGYTELSYRFNTTKGNPYHLEQVSFSPIDDYFGYRGLTWLNSLKWQINERLWARVNHTYFQLQYVNRPVYAYDFDNEQWYTDSTGYLIELAPVRKDQGYFLEFQLGYRLANILNKASDLEIQLLFTIFDNKSNDLYFQTDSYSVGLKFNYDLQW
jgi:hypothetical protein